MGGILRGLHAATPSIAAQISTLLRTLLKLKSLEISLRMVTQHGTENRPQCDPQAVTRLTT
jgi:hypothetical protein